MLGKLLMVIVVAGLMFLFWCGSVVEIVAVCAVLYSAGINVTLCCVTGLAMYVQALAAFIYMKRWVTGALDEPPKPSM